MQPTNTLVLYICMYIAQKQKCYAESSFTQANIHKCM